VTVYWVTIAAVGYFVFLSRRMDPGLDERPMGQIPATFTSRLGLALASLILICVAGLRWGVGTDFFGYVRNYDIYKVHFFTDLRNFDEPGLKGLAWLVSKLHDDSSVFIFAASALTLGLALWTLTRYSTAVLMSFLLFIFVGNWHDSFNGVRQYLAAAIIFAGHRFIVDKRPIRYALVVLLASSVHISALAMAMLYFVPRKKLRVAMILPMVGAALAALYASDAVLGLIEVVTEEEVTLTTYVTTAVNPLRIAVAVAPALLYWTKGARTEADGEWFYRNMAMVHAAVMLAASWSAYLGRFGIYTTVFLPLVLPRLIDFHDRRLTLLARGAALLLYAAFWYVEVSGSSALNDFHFLWETEGRQR
jgi:hypothetical protein